jgi:hypothetical protein
MVLAGMIGSDNREEIGLYYSKEMSIDNFLESILSSFYQAVKVIEEKKKLRQSLSGQNHKGYSLPGGKGGVPFVY